MTTVRQPVAHGTGAALAVRDATVRYAGAGRTALDKLEFMVEPGEFCVLVGPSGCGKSTLLRTLNRMVALDAGRIEIDGRDVTARDAIELRREIGYVIQSGGLFPHYTVARNIAVVPELLGWKKPEIAARVDELLRLVRLDPARYGARKPRSLSGGEMQRVGVARALAARPRLVLMDEPFGALDPVVRASLQTELIVDVRALGTTTVFVTHDVDEALLLADRILVMRDGRVEQFATPIEILRQPANAFVSAFMNSADRVRQLRIISVRKLLTALGRPPLSAETAEDFGRSVMLDSTLYDALNVFLAQPGLAEVSVVHDGRRMGTLALAELLRFTPPAP